MTEPASSPDLAAVLALIQAQEAARQAATAQAVALTQGAVQVFSGWYSTDAVTGWSARLTGQVEALLRVTARTTDAYLARLVAMLTGRVFRPAGAVDVTDLRNGTTGAGAFARAADVYRWQQAQHDRAARALLGQPNPRPPTLQAPLDAAADRAGQVAETGVQLAGRAQTQRTLAAAGDLVTGYRRIIHPELAKGGTCGLCVAAADRIYKIGELLPLHGGCHCTVAPIVGELDPGLHLNQLDIRRLYKAAGGTDRAGLRRVRYQTYEHGELGPVLAAADAKPRTAPQARAAAHTGRPRTPQQRAAAIRTARDSLKPALARVDELAGQDPATWGDYRDQLADRVTQLEADAKAA